MSRAHRAVRALAIACCVFGAAPARGADPDPGWELSVAPYLWASALEGTLDTDVVETDIDVEFSDIVDAMDAGLLVALEARRGRISLVANGIYLRLEDDAERALSPVLPAAPPGSLDLEFAAETAMAEGFAGYEVWSAPRLALDLRLGARYWYVRQKVDVTLLPGVPLPPFDRSFDESGDWVDAVAGARLRAALSERVGLTVAGDYGGFGWGSSSEPSWSVHAFLSIALGRHWQLAAGWRHLELERGPLEIRMLGPLLGASYRF